MRWLVTVDKEENARLCVVRSPRSRKGLAMKVKLVRIAVVLMGLVALGLSSGADIQVGW